MRRLLHDGEGRKPVAEVEVHVEFRGGLMPPVPRPVEAVECQLYRGGVERVYGSILEAGGEAPVLARREFRADRLEVLEHPPEHELRHLRVAPAVGVRERVAVRDLRPAHPSPLALERHHRVAHAVQGLRPRELLVDQRQEMAPRRERPREDFCLRGRIEHDLRGYQLDYICFQMVYTVFVATGGGNISFFMIPVAYRKPSPVATPCRKIPGRPLGKIRHAVTSMGW